MGTNVYVKYWVIHVPPKHVEGPLTSKSGSDRLEKGKESGIARIGGDIQDTDRLPPTHTNPFTYKH